MTLIASAREISNMARSGLERLQLLAVTRNGTVATAFALACLPILMLIGLAVDFGFISQARAQLDLAADTAALTATRTAGSAFIASGSTATAVTLGQNDGVAWFTAQVGLIPNAHIVGVPSVTVTPNGNTFTSVVTYSAQVSTFFSQVLGYPRNFVTLSNTSDATITANAYVDVTFLLDNSSSMLIAATENDITNMENLSAAVSGSNQVTLTSSEAGNKGLPCAFACHWDTSGAGKDYYGFALKAGIQLRFNVVQSAVAQAISLMATAQTTSGIANQFGTSIYTFNNTLSQVYPASGGASCHGSVTIGCDLTTGSNGAQTIAKTIATPLTCDTCTLTVTGDTSFPSVMAALAAQSPAAGDGATTATARKALIIVTDGIQDWGTRTQVPGYGLTANITGGAEGPISPADCNAMKALGYDVYVLYTTYFTQDAKGQTSPLVPFNEFLIPYVNNTGSPVAYNLTPNMTACASNAANFAEASDPAAITAAMTAMLQSVINSGARLTY